MELFKMLLGSLLMDIALFEGEGGTEGAGSDSGEGSGANESGSSEGQGQEGQGNDNKGQAEGDQQVADWRVDLDPEIKDHACLKDFKTKNDAVKAYVGAQKLIGIDKLPIPPKDAKPEVREKFLREAFTRLGLPKEAKDYKVSDVKLPEGVDIKTSPEDMDAFKAEAHKLGILPHQLDGIYKWHLTNAGNKLKAYQDGLVKSRQDTEAQLRQEFGSAYEGKVAKAQEMLNKFAGNDYKALLDSGFGNKPEVIRFMTKIADIISEDSFAKGGGEATMTPEEALKEIPALNKKLANMEKTDPEYQSTLKRKREVYEMAYKNEEGKSE